jgi:hypothetical protein
LFFVVFWYADTFLLSLSLACSVAVKLPASVLWVAS